MLLLRSGWSARCGERPRRQGDARLDDHLDEHAASGGQRAWRADIGDPEAEVGMSLRDREVGPRVDTRRA